MGVTHLVDTHILLWLFSEPNRIPEYVRDALADRTNPLLVSSASALEIAAKVRLGKPKPPVWCKLCRPACQRCCNEPADNGGSCFAGGSTPFIAIRSTVSGRSGKARG